MRMKAIVILGLAMLSVSSVPGQDEKKPAKKDEDRIRGTWMVESGKKGGENAPEEFVEKFRLTFKKDGQFTAVLPDKEIQGTYTIDATKKPKQIDVSHDGKTMEGIYEFDGKQLKLCIGEPAQRPTEFASPEGSHTMLMVLKRAKTK
jgi:uncharacterized protein (TIGR03067 family)